VAAVVVGAQLEKKALISGNSATSGIESGKECVSSSTSLPSLLLTHWGVGWWNPNLKLRAGGGGGGGCTPIGLLSPELLIGDAFSGIIIIAITPVGDAPVPPLVTGTAAVVTMADDDKSNWAYNGGGPRDGGDDGEAINDGISSVPILFLVYTLGAD